jgi:hypothetical protein
MLRETYVTWKNKAVIAPAAACVAPHARSMGGRMSEGMELTVDSFDGTRVTGTFRGVIGRSVSNPDEPPATIERGTFSAILREVGI